MVSLLLYIGNYSVKITPCSEIVLLSKLSTPPKNIGKIYEYADKLGANIHSAVRQRTARQQTTMSSMRTLPHYLYTNDDLAESTIPYSANLLLY